MVYAAGWGVPSRSLGSLVRSLLIFLAGVAVAMLCMHWHAGARTGDGAAPTPLPSERSRMFYNPGWRGGPITLATADSRYKPQGQHIMLDVYDSDPEFLNDMEAMTKVSRDLLVNAGMHILSSSSHQLAPQGVSITFTIEESHLTIHTWPEHKGALIDLFTCGTTQLLPILPQLAASFKTTLNKSKWSIHFRGENKVTDLQENVLKNRWGSKEKIYSGASEFQAIDVWRNQLDGNSPVEAGSVNLYLDGSLQSSTGDEHIYHESLVHPAMLAHPSAPKKVAIVGGGDLAGTRELLKHKSIESVHLVELDPAVTEVTKAHMKSLNNCSFGSGEYRSCVDDERVHVHNTDSVKFFKQQCKSNTDTFDIIFMDLLDPEQHPEIGGYLYSKAHFESLKCVLKDDGMLVAQIGDAPSHELGLRLRLGSKKTLIEVMRSMFGANATFLYDAYVPSFRGEWSFLVGCGSAKCVERWHRSIAEIDATVQERILPNALPLKFFDGAVMANFQQPSIAWHSLV